MKNLNVNTSTVLTEDPEISKLVNRINYLESWLCDLLIRSPEKRQHDINTILNNISNVPKSEITYYVLNTFNENYFKNEPDTEFKIELCNMLLQHIRTFYPEYKSNTLQSIAENNSELTANYIYAGSLK